MCGDRNRKSGGRRFQVWMLTLPVLTLPFLRLRQVAAFALCLALALEEYWTKPPAEVRTDDFNRVTYEPKPSLT